MSDLKETVFIQFIKYWPVKWLFIILLGLVVVSGFYHFYRCGKGLNSRFLWGAQECVECKAVTVQSITKVDTVIIHDTIKVPLIASSGKPKTIQKNEQKIDSGGSGIQNNAPNYGNQAGRDINQYGTLPRQVRPEQLRVFFREFPDKNIKIGFQFVGSQDGEMINVKTSIIKFLRENGYNNIDEFDGFAIRNEVVKEIMIEPQKDGSVLFVIPPASPK